MCLILRNSCFFSKANIKRGNQRGLLFRNFDYELNLFGNAHDGMMITNPGRKLSYSIFQSRIYNLHVPRKVLIGVNLIKKQFRMSVTRPGVDDPAQTLMHAQTIVTVKGQRIGQEVAEVKRHCPNCESRTVVSRGTSNFCFHQFSYRHVYCINEGV